MFYGILTVVFLILFIGLWVWAWQPRLRKGFEATARLAVDDNTIPPSEVRSDRHEEAGP